MSETPPKTGQAKRDPAKRDPAKTGQARFKSALTGPISTEEPTFLHDVDMDRMVGAFVALCGEVYVMRDRLRTLEAALEKAGAVTKGAVEAHEEDSEAAAANAADASAFVARVFSELHRSDVPMSNIGYGGKKPK